MPVTMPEELTEAILVALLLHVPPVPDEVSVVEAPVQTDVAPEMVPAEGAGEMVKE